MKSLHGGVAAAEAQETDARSRLARSAHRGPPVAGGTHQCRNVRSFAKNAFASVLLSVAIPASPPTEKMLLRGHCALADEPFDGPRAAVVRAALGNWLCCALANRQRTGFGRW